MASTIDRCIEAGLAYLDAERRLERWEMCARVYAMPSGVAEEGLKESGRAVATKGLELMLCEQMEQGLWEEK
jgi:hypothetical protein